VIVYLFDLPRQHAAFDTQHCGDVDVLPAHVIHPVGEALYCRLEEHPGELDDVEHSLDDVVCRGGAGNINAAMEQCSLKTSTN